MCTGCVATIKAVVSESSDDSNQAFGLSVLATAMTLGYVVGPAVSGLIADPITEYNITTSKFCVCICSLQFANLCNFENVLCKLEIAKLLTNFETGIRFQNCIALLRILEIAPFLKQTAPIDAIATRSARH